MQYLTNNSQGGTEYVFLSPLKLQEGQYIFKGRVLFENGVPVSNATISGLNHLNSTSAVTTDDSGNFIGYWASKTPTLTLVINYIDIPSYPVLKPTGNDLINEIRWIIPHNTTTNRLYTWDQNNLEFSPMVKDFDVALVGAGGKGGKAYFVSSSTVPQLGDGGQGGGGGYVTNSYNLTPQKFSIVIGKGGGTEETKATTISTLSLKALGGKDGSYGGVGNGNGGRGGYYNNHTEYPDPDSEYGTHYKTAVAGGSGGAPSIFPFDDKTLLASGGGGGGGIPNNYYSTIIVNGDNTGGQGGLPNGGTGGYGDDRQDGYKDPEVGKTPGGGGGGASIALTHGSPHEGANGGDGGVFLRWRYKSYTPIT